MGSYDYLVASSARASAERSPTVFVIDPDLASRDLLESLIRRTGWRSHMFTSAEHFLASRPQVVGTRCLVSEAVLPGLGGLELQALLAGEQSLPVIFLTSHWNVSTTVRAVKAGAVEFLTKPLLEDTLMLALRNAFERSSDALRQEDELRTLRERYARLSERERAVMSLVVLGLLNKKVGERLCISEITVKAHRGKVMRKMEADSLPALVHMAATLGLPRLESRVNSRAAGPDRSPAVRWMPIGVSTIAGGAAGKSNSSAVARSHLRERSLGA